MKTTLIDVKRHAFKDGYTIGRLYVDGAYVCDTLEDVVRAGAKVFGKTAIPTGTYKIKITTSPKFGRDLPELEAVPNFTAVRIHAGNTAEDTEGCILVGFNRSVGRLEDSRICENYLNSLLKTKTDMRISITNV